MKLSTRAKARYALLVALPVALVAYPGLRSGRASYRKPAPLRMLPADPGRTHDAGASPLALPNRKDPFRLPAWGCDWYRAIHGVPWPKETVCLAPIFDNGIIRLDLGSYVTRPDTPDVKPKGKEIWIGTFGASSVEGYTDIGASWPKRLEQILNDGHPGQPFRVFNYGMAGSGSTMALFRLGVEGPRRGIDYAILYTSEDLVHCHFFSDSVENAIAEFEFDGDPSHIEAVDPWFGKTRDSWLETRRRIHAELGAAPGESLDAFKVRVQSLITATYKARGEHPEDQESFDPAQLSTSFLASVPPGLLEGYTTIRNVRAFIRKARENGITPIVIVPTWGSVCRDPSYRDLFKFDQVCGYYRLTATETVAFQTHAVLPREEAVAKEEGALVWNAFDAIRQSEDPCRLMSDIVHPSPDDGFETVARGAAQVIQADAERTGAIEVARGSN